MLERSSGVLYLTARVILGPYTSRIIPNPVRSHNLVLCLPMHPHGILVIRTVEPAS
jgi:hypothetical protein